MKLTKLRSTYFRAIICLGFILIGTTCIRAQTVSVYPRQNLSFGAIILGTTTGTVTVSNSGVRSSTGDLILAGLGVFYFPATFEIEAPANKSISILTSTNTQLSSINGGSMMLSLGIPDKGSLFINMVAPPQRTTISIGGTLTVGNEQSNPAGSYSGTFSITFIQE
ncbi:MAG TPA: DUF4402 domain-containing protein [Pedobacter sp.]